MSNSLILKMRQQIRQETLRAIEGLTDTEMTEIAKGASNNILWNIGHVLYDEYCVLYEPCGLPNLLPPGFKELFASGTSPRDWIESPDVSVVCDCFRTFNLKVHADYEEDKFTGFKPYPLDEGTPVDTIDEALAFDALHESSHYGVIVTLRRLILSGDRKS